MLVKKKSRLVISLFLNLVQARGSPSKKNLNMGQSRKPDLLKLQTCAIPVLEKGHVRY